LAFCQRRTTCSATTVSTGGAGVLNPGRCVTAAAAASDTLDAAAPITTPKSRMPPEGLGDAAAAEYEAAEEEAAGD